MQEKIIVIAFLLAIVFTAGCIKQGEQPELPGGQPQNIAGGAYGTVRGAKNITLENAHVSIVSLNGSANYSATTDKNGKYNITNMPDGVYTLAVQKAGYRDSMPLPFLIFGGHSYDLDVTINRDCYYYSINTTTNYFVRYGYNGTLYRGDMTVALPYPEGAAYAVSPDAKSGLSVLRTTYKAGNRMLKWTLNNSKGSPPIIHGYFYMDLNGTQETQLIGAKEMKIPDAASSQPGYLGSEIYNDTDGRAMIDPSNSEIKAIAEQIRNGTESDDAWTVAKAMFVWVKNNTAYHINEENKSYTQSAIEVLRSRQGDCAELSFLYISMCRAAGIPARFVEGFLVSKEPEEYSAHAWAEFYDGQWVPIELSDSWVRSNNSATIGFNSFDINSYAMNEEVAIHFGVLRSDHVATFVDDGTSESINRGDISPSHYYDHPPSFSPYVYYGAENYNTKYIIACSDGTRTLAEEKEWAIQFPAR